MKISGLLYCILCLVIALLFMELFNYLFHNNVANTIIFPATWGTLYFFGVEKFEDFVDNYYNK